MRGGSKFSSPTVRRMARVMDNLSMLLSQDDLLWVLGSLSQLHHKPFEPKLISQQFTPPYDITVLIKALRALEFEPEHHNQSCLSVAEIVYPCIAFLKKTEFSPDNNTTNKQLSADEGKQELIKPILVIRKDSDRILYFKAGEQTPTMVEHSDFENSVQNITISIKANEVPVEKDEITVKKQAFGFRWFIPELLRYKKIWREVILASFAIQLMGLTMPLFTQVVIDKVIVHHTMNTLLVIGIGLLMFMIFTAAMTWVRQYLIFHTGNRVDAILGSKVFSHLFALPIRYFEQRPTGTLIARVQGIETIRGFITGAAVTLILDFPFLFIFLAIMLYYSWQLTLIVLAVLALITIISLSVTPV